ncbi:MAG: glycoside hydrolase, partial [Melioribacteraceae bacterium]|nr:glycoside hydrolase [Melioribacteraceae bacterium]
MKKYFNNHFVLFLLLSGFVLISIDSLVEQNSIKVINNENKITKLSKDAKKKARADFFFNIMRDPQTNTIPKNIRTKELNHAKSLSIKNKNLLEKTEANEFDWFEVGPNDVGGRTRAIAVDVTNSNNVIAAGVSGGIWKSTNNGDTWEFKNKSSELLSITSIVQDPRPGFTNNWYACGGEFDGSSASDRGYRAYFRGNGILKSTDNGENWNLIVSTSSNPTKWDSDFDYMSRLIINPNTGSLFGISNGFGIIKSTDGGESFSGSLGGLNNHYYADLAIKSDGTLVAVISSQGFTDTPENTPGVYKSTDDGETWTDITPAGFPIEHERSVLASSNLTTPIFYVLSFTGEYFSATNSDGEAFDNETISLFKLSTDNSVTEDLSANLPSFQAYFDGQGYLFSQGNYNMVIAVKPDDDNFVLIAGTSLFRSTNGFSTKISNNTLNWIGGYHGVDPFYPNLHPDVHKITFDPNDPNKVWVGHDGGLSYTDNISNESYTKFFPWVKKNNSYNVTQFYTVSIHKDSGDKRIMGGTQDNGTPYFKFDNLVGQTEDLSSGDGAYCYFSSGSFAYASIYNGKTYRFKYNSQGDPVWDALTTDVTPTDAEGQLFINPFVIDPNPTERYMYYPAGNTLWRNNDIRQQN